MQDETPRSCDEKVPMVFLFQLARDTRFQMADGAPAQIEFSFLSGRKAQPSRKGYYELFLGNALYVFGTVGLNPALLFPIVQK